MQKVELYTDGSSRGNPGPAGYGLILKFGKHEKEFAEGFRRSTNNRMELMAVIKGLELLSRPNQKVVVYSDSRYVTNAMSKKWIYGWIKKDFKNIKNPDLWRRYLAAARLHTVEFIWVKGHNNHEYNERCDKLAVNAALAPTKVDIFYEANEQSNS